MKFLITGGAGFIGSHVCERLLHDGHAVWAVDDLNPFYDPQIKRANLRDIQKLARPFEFIQGDITDRSVVDELFGSVKFDQVIHLAARAGVRPSLVEPALYQRVNVEGTVNILEAARLSGVRKIIMASSSSVYGVNSKTPFSEADPIFSAVSPYAASKLACEALGHVYHHVYGLDVAMLRFFTVYGPRQRPDLAIHKFTRLIHGGKPIPVFGDGGTARDHTYITDILDGIMACTRYEFGFEVFNLGESQTIRLDQLIALIEKALGKTAIIDRQPLQPGDVPITYADITKAGARLGYHPQVKADQGIPNLLVGFCAIMGNIRVMNMVENTSRPTLSAVLDTWKKTLSERGHSTNLTWIFEENLCIERSKLDKGGFHFGFQTKFSAIPEDALEIAYDQFCLTDAQIVFYRLGHGHQHSVCMLLCDSWFDTRGDSEGYLRHDEWGVSFHPGLNDNIEEVTDLGRWLRRVRRDRGLHPLDFGMSLATIDEIMLYGRPLMPYERFTSRMVSRLRQILRPAA